MFCASCGAPLEAGATFCHRCGAMLSGPLPAAQAAVDPAMAAIDAGAAASEAVRRTFRHFGRFLATQGIFLLLAAAISLGIGLLVLNEAIAEVTRAVEAQDLDAALGALPPLLAAGGTSFVVTLVLRAIGVALGVHVADSIERGAPIGLGEAWMRAAPRLGNYLLTSIAVGAAAAGCILAGLVLFFLVVPVFAGIGFAIYLLVVWCLVAPIAMLETRGIGDNLRRSAALTKGHRGELFVCLAAIVLAGAIPAGIVGFAMASVAPPDALGVPSAEQTIVGGVVGAATSLLTGFVMSNFLVRVYRQRVPPSP